MDQLITRFREMLDEELPEQKYQRFLEQNTEFIPHEFIQNHGIHLDLVIRKLPLSADRKTDFFYMSKSSGDWNLVLIELEKPRSRYFNQDGETFHEDFRSGLQQINEWRAWFEDEANRTHFIHSTVGPFRRPLAGNPCRIKYVLVTGRRAELEDSPTKRARVTAQERDDFKILSYDSLLERVRTRGRLYVGVRRVNVLEIVSATFLSDQLFVYVPTEMLRISDELRADAERKRHLWLSHKPSPDLKLITWMDEKLPQVGRTTAQVAGADE